MYKWYLPTLSEIIQADESDIIQKTRTHRQADQGEKQWYGAIAALNALLSSAPATDGPDVGSSCSGEDSDMPIKGLILSGPFPVINQSVLGQHFASWTLTGDPTLRIGSLQLPSADKITPHHQGRRSPENPTAEPLLMLHPDDPLAVEPFCIVLMPNLSVLLTLGLDDTQTPQFFLSFDPDTIWQGWRSIRSRLQLTTPAIVARLDCIANQFTPTTPDYQTVMEFTQLMMMKLPSDRPMRSRQPFRTAARLGKKKNIGHQPDADISTSALSDDHHPYPSKPLNVNRTDRMKLDTVVWDNVLDGPRPQGPKGSKGGPHHADASTSQPAREEAVQFPGGLPKNEVRQAHIGSDVELLKALAHEVRTPLTTIRTLTRLLMRRNDLVDVVLKRLEQIDNECTKQIDRFSLIFKAVELETASPQQTHNHLAKISLANMFQQNVSRWQHQAKQRNLTLDVALPPTLPSVMSDPTMLDQVLTGLMDRMTHTLPPGTLIQLSVVPAGHQLKLQFWAKPQADSADPLPGKAVASMPMSPEHDGPTDGPKSCMHSIFAPTLQSVGQLLMFQPETGNLSLNLDVTKNIFQALGGKLIVRHTPTKGEVLTIFLPMEDTHSNGLSPKLNGKYFC